MSQLMQCPTQDELADFGLGKLSDQAQQTLANHVDSCSACSSKLLSVRQSSDAFLEALRKSSNPSSPIFEEPELLRLRDRAAAISVAAPELLESEMPAQIGQYRLIRPLGRGGMGTVYLAQHARLKRLVALKLLPIRQQQDTQTAARFLQEMEAIGKLDHTHVIKASDAGEAEGYLFLVMDYVEGMDLSRLVGQRKRLSVPDACEVVRQAALGLQYIHEQGLVHRDIKTSNLLLGTDGRLRILDLGLARLTRTSEEQSGLTETGQVMGTLDYMAPEQGDDSHQVDIRADIYSLGCTLYKLLSGAPPFSGKAYASRVKKLMGHAKHSVPPLYDSFADVPRPVDAIVQKMLAKIPADRFTTPAELAAALLPWCRGSDPAALMTEALAGEHTIARGDIAQETSSLSPQEDSKLRLTKPHLSAQVRTWPTKRVRQTGFALAALGMVAAVVGVLAFGADEPDQAGKGEPSPGKNARPQLDPLVWHSLLKQPPREILWHRPSADYKWRLNPKLEELEVQAPALGLLGLGSIDKADYTIRLGFRQFNWTGGIGLFFGYQKKQRGKSWRADFQVIQVQEVGGGRVMHRLILGRSMNSLESNQGGGPAENQGFVGIPLQFAKPGKTEQILEITVQRGSLRKVLWDGKECPELVKPEVNAQFANIGYDGDFGIYGCQSVTKIRNAQLLILERKNQ